MRFFWSSIIVIFALCASAAGGEAPFPRVPPTAADKAIQTFQLHKGLRIELVASEPMIESPVGICFDEDGRLFVVEMRDYPDLREQALGRIKLLEDTKASGHYDRAGIFADHLPWPTSVFCYGGGIYVTASPDILWLADTRGAGKADQRKAIFTGFGITTDPLNVQDLLNNLNWRLDDRIEGATSFNGGLVRRPGAADKPLDLHGRDFSFDPRTLAMAAESGGGQHGLSFDEFGRKFVCMNSKPIQTFMYDARYAARNALYTMPPALVDVASDGQDVYRISPEEAWRVLRTKLRVAGQVSGPIEGGGRSAGYFTGVSGITIYTGDALPAQFHGNAFIGEVANNLVHREVIVPDGVNVIAHRAPEERTTEFLASTDNWFRPVQFANGPDGALYIVDMYREVIEHPWSLPDYIRNRLDLHSGADRGRIWRIVPEGFVARAAPKLSKASTAELVALLDHPNGWHRDAAARLLYQRHDPKAAPLLRELLAHARTPIGRLRALCALEGQDAIEPAQVLAALRDEDPHVRQRGVLICERWLRSDACPPELWARLREMAADPDIRVRYQLALSLGESRRADRADALAQIAARDIGDPWMQAAILSSSANIEAPLFAAFANHAQSSEAGQQFLAELAELIGRRGADSEVAQVAGVIQQQAKSRDQRTCLALASALRDGVIAGHSDPDAGPARLREVLTRARAILEDSSASEAVRAQAARLLGTSNFEECGKLLLSLLRTDQPQDIQLAAVESLGRFVAPEVGPELVKRFGSFSPPVRSGALAALLRRPDRALAMLHAIESGKMKASDLTTAQQAILRRSTDPAVGQLAQKLLSARSPREPVVQKFQPALALNGNASKGHLIYQQRCAQCHRLGGEGFSVGPDLTTIRQAGKPKALVNIIDPNREVAANYLAYLLESRSGDLVVGIIAAESASSVTIRQPFGKETVVPRSEIRRLESQRISLMPEGLEEQLSDQDFADLLEFIFTAGRSR